MKTCKIILIALLTFISTNMLGQDNHMKFKGVDLTGTRTVFFQELSKNMDITPGGKGTYFGTFAGYKNCKIHIESSVKTNTVYGVHIYIRGGSNLVYSYKNKYGDYEYWGDGYYKWEFDNGYIYIKPEGSNIHITYEDKIGSDLDVMERDEIRTEKEKEIYKDI